ncbi:MAG TPA: hypothetical protein VGO59_03965 [Verrucomicrobiae bacterium]|jgi:hypothetical protein
MRIGNKFLAALSTALVSALMTGKSSAAGSADPVAAQYYFAGASDLAVNTNFARAWAIFHNPTGTRFMDLALDRWTSVFWDAFQFGPNANASTLLRPALNDLTGAESAGSFGGRDKDRLDFVIAARLNVERAGAWEKSLDVVMHGPGEALVEQGFSGHHWTLPGGGFFWILRARDWTVVGRGDGLSAVCAAYLQHIKQDNRPVAAVKDRWLSADVDWPRLAEWAPISNSPFKLARTVVDVTAENGRMHTTAHVIYPEAIPWTPTPWRIPKDLVNTPLNSFTATQDLQAYMMPNQLLSRLSGNPLAGQLFFWGLREMVLENAAAWPVADATSALRKLAAEAPAVLNPWLAARDKTQFDWFPKADRLIWSKLPFTTPAVDPAHGKDGDFLLAELFPFKPKIVPASDQLWGQFENRNDLVYYDWEITGPRLRQWRLLSELLPILPPPTHADDVRHENAAKNTKLPMIGNEPATPLIITEEWLAELSAVLGNTVTEAVHTSPTELTVTRSSQFLFTSLELVELSHWLADSPIGPIDKSLLPFAKMSGPGMPRTH